MKKKSTLALCCLFLFLTLSFQTLAQQKVGYETNRSLLASRAKESDINFKAKQKKAFEHAGRKGWPKVILNSTGRKVVLYDIDNFGYPLYKADDNVIAAGTTKANKLYNNTSLGISVTGASIPIDRVALWDGGSARRTHNEFAGNKIKIGDVETSSQHASHVAGTILAIGAKPEAKGVAYGLPNILSYDFNNDVSEMNSQAPNLLLSNHSYGTIAGWYNNPSTLRWEFYGRDSENEDYKFGYYSDVAKSWDEMCFAAPYYLPVKSSGNNRSVNGPGVGQSFYRYNSANIMTGPHSRPEGMSSNNGYDIIATSGNAKNILTVGAINGLANGATQASDIVISNFSSWGPTDDGRIKPDVVANGVSLESASSGSDSEYVKLSGTSMSAPNATGTLVLLQDLYFQKNASFMRSATLKGLAIGTAKDAGIAPGPDYIFGWGLIDAEAAAKVILDNMSLANIKEDIIENNTTKTYTVVAKGNAPLIATMAWTDPAATPVTTSVLNNRTPRLVNDLDLRASTGDDTFMPWILDPNNPALPATKGDNHLDNVEQILIENPVAGQTYTFTVSHKGNLRNDSQYFSMIFSGIGETTYCASTTQVTNNANISSITIDDETINNTNGCGAYFNFSEANIALVPSKTYQMTLALTTCGTNVDKVAKVFVDWNSDGDFNDDGELVYTSAVIGNSTSQSFNLAVPTSALGGAYSKMRVVVVETADETLVTPCMASENGQVLDYTVRLMKPIVSTGVTTVLLPLNGLYAEPYKAIAIKLKNFGAAKVSTVPFQIDISEGGTLVKEIKETYLGEINPDQEVLVTSQFDFNFEVGKTYTISAKTVFYGDVIAGDDEKTETFSAMPPPTIGRVSAYNTDNPLKKYLYSTHESGTVQWFKANTAQYPISSGLSTVTTELPIASNTYYVGLNNYFSTLGPADAYQPGYGNIALLNVAGFKVNFYVKGPSILESAWIYAYTTGTAKFRVEKSGSTYAKDYEFSLTGGVGKIVKLNFEFPDEGNYSIVSLTGERQIFANVNAVPEINVYPYKDFSNSVQLLGHNATGLLNNFYIMFYNVKFKPFGPLVETKTAVVLEQLSISQDGNLLKSPIATGNQWYLNDTAIPGATSSTYSYTQTGNYTLKITLPDATTITSDPLTISVLPLNMQQFTLAKHLLGVNLFWNLPQLTGAQSFTLKKAGEDGVFSTINTQQITKQNNYKFVDDNPNNGINYYKLSATLTDGNDVDLATKSINFSVGDNEGINVYPNPTKGNVTVKISNSEIGDTYLLNIFNAAGKNVLASAVQGYELTTGANVNLAHLSEGVYTLSVTSKASGKVIGVAKVTKK